MAVNKVNHEVVTLLLGYGANPDTPRHEDSMYPLQQCISLLSKCNTEQVVKDIVKCVESLLMFGAKVNMPYTCVCSECHQSNPKVTSLQLNNALNIFDLFKFLPSSDDPISYNFQILYRAIPGCHRYVD